MLFRISGTIDVANIFGVFVLAFAIAAALTPVSIRIAKRIGAIDVPRDDRRMHTRRIPRFGGFAIFISTMVVIWLTVGYNRNIRIAMIGGLLMYLLGAVDDVKSLRARYKFIGQTIIAIFVYALGIRISFITNFFGPGKMMLSGAVCFIITTLWIVGITNTINLIDGLDGLAAGVSAIICLSMAYVAYIHGNIFGSAVVCIALTAVAGACVGFLPFNFSPAKTFMGDSGALFLGYMIAVLSVISPLKRATFIAVVVPTVTLAIPILDTFAAMLRRAMRKKSIMSPDKEHIHHMLVASGYDHKRSVIMLYGITGIMGMAAVLISRELYKDAVILMIIVISYLYVFTTDPAHRREERKREKEQIQQEIIEEHKEEIRNDIIEEHREEIKQQILADYKYELEQEIFDEQDVDV